MTRVTRAEAHVLRELKRFIEIHGYNPSQSELARVCELDVRTIRYHVQKMKRRGLVDYNPREHHSLTPLERSA